MWCDAVVAADAVGEGRTIEVSIFGDVDPMVIDGDVLRFRCGHLQPMGLEGPFSPKHLVAPNQSIKIVNEIAGLVYVAEHTRPPFPILGLHAAGCGLPFTAMCR